MVNLGLFSGTKPMKSVKVSFRLPYYTQWGQSLLVCGSEPVLGSWNVKKGLLLSPVNQGVELIWMGSVAVPSGFECEYNYYVVDDDKNILRWEMGKRRKLLLSEGILDGEVVECHDLWQVSFSSLLDCHVATGITVNADIQGSTGFLLWTGSDDHPFRSAFKNVIFNRTWNLNIERPLGAIQNKLDEEVLVQFKICCPHIEEDTSVYVIGSHIKLGQWKVQDGLKLSYAGKFSLEYGSNRELTVGSSKNQLRYIFLSDGMFRELPWRGAGVAIPMFSVRSESDLGVGEFLDLKLLVDWAVDSGFHLIQLLPINDTSVHGMWWDSYPYSSLSVCALHPLYLKVQALSESIPDDIKKEIQEAKQRLDGKFCNTEKKIAAKLKSFAESSVLLEDENKIRRDLFDLLQNIVLIRDSEDPRKFYPRFNIEDTSSFKDLDEHSKCVLKRLYYDYYFYRQENLWRENALKTLPVLLNSSEMLACGEDLGLIPSCVHPVMQELALIGLRIQRMPSEPGLEFGIPSEYSYMTVCASSCHDCSTMRAWWEEDEERRCRFFESVVGSDMLPPSRCVPDIANFIIRQHVEAPSMWAIFPLQDLLALKEEYTTRPAAEETINDPTNPKHYWRYRVHVTLESLMKDNELKAAIKDLVRGSGRSYPVVEENEVEVKEETTATSTGKQQVANGKETMPLGSELTGVPQKETLVVL
ncbi:4-alpha-glucanotransferase DPE2 [Morella rubra]|uniref:4-alpha-glucanotransferase n=1 Tax=Morella rubra TaxID=262757 RepID=A0A6A1WFL8_9ROSI|nr:4-alpha-glucanotransferase DPE2 [Morella rubra]